MKLLKFTLLSVFFFSSFALIAQEVEKKENPSIFILSGEYRNIGEYRDGYQMILPDSLYTQKTHPGVFVRQRVRFSADYMSDKFDSQFTVQDIRVWGDNATAVNSNSATLGIREAWFKYKLNEKFGVKIGRQVL